jgi:hypothetical protein
MAKLQNLSGLLRDVQLAAQGDGKVVSIGDVVDRLGRRSFGPVLLLAALPTLTPISTIPGVAVGGAIIIQVTAVQMALGYERLRLPAWFTRRTINKATICRASRWLRPAAAWIDRLIQPRLTRLVEPPFLILISVACLLLSAVMFPLQLVPFTSGIPSFPVALFGLAMIARDGVLAIAGSIGTAIVLATAATFLTLGTKLL